MTEEGKRRKCPINPICPFLEDIIGLKKDVSWLKKFLAPQLIVELGTFITVLAIIVDMLGLV